MMRKRHISIIVCICISVYTFSQDIEAPVNPEFIKWHQKKLNGETSSGDIPYYVLPNFNGLIKKASSPKSFDQIYDLRTTGYLTPVKNQGSCGVCWTFAAAGTIESYMLKNGMGTMDFSEQNIRTCHGFVPDINLACSGGNPKMAAAYFTRTDGPIDETVDAYNTDEYETCTSGLPVQYRVDQFRLFNDTMDIVKQAILDYGALYTNMYNDATYYNSGDYTYYYGGTASTDHAILLSGWDDTKVTAGGTGAWIIKNSWGTSWGENGFFYISYNDTKVLSTVAAYPGISLIETGDKIYMYDELGWIGNTGYSTETGYGLIKFIADGNEQINSVGTYINSEAATVTFDIYDTKSGNTLSGLLASVGPYSCDYPGFYKIDLTTPVTLTTGQDFYIKAEYNTPGYLFPIPYEKFSTDYADPVIEAGVCWISSSGASWTIMGNDVSGKERDLCIRAYTGEISSSIDKGEMDYDDIILSPQPASDYLNVQLKGNYESHELQILSIDSKILKKITTNKSDSHTVFVGDLPAGLYFLQIISNNNKSVYIKKWIKE